MKKQFRVFVAEVHNPKQLEKAIEFFSISYGIHYLVYAESKQEAAEKVAPLIASAIDTKVKKVENYLGSALEWMIFCDNDVDINIGVEQM